MPRDSVMERKMFKAQNNSAMPAGGELSTWFSLIVKFSSAGLEMFAIGLVPVGKLNIVVKSTPKSKKNLQLSANNGITVLVHR